MWSTYRLAYLGVAALVMGGVVFVAAEAEYGRTNSGLSFAAFLLSQLNLDGSSSLSDDGTEPGNLSEVGAKEILKEADYLVAMVMSGDQPVLVFKHSTECDVSGGAYRRTAEWLENRKERGETVPAVFLVKVIEHRSMSELIAKHSDVKHESPQAILFREGGAVWDRDHEKITAAALDKAMAKFGAEDSADETTD